MRIRTAAVAELGILRDIEWAAGACFRDVGMAEVADDEPLSVEELAGFQRVGRAWVAVEDGAGPDGGLPIAYLIADLVDGSAHVEQVSVHPAFARRRVGRALLEHVAGLARRAGLPAVTLTTFAEVPWNAPYYERCGFRRLEAAELTPGLRRILRREAAYGLDRWPRVAMRRDLG